MLWIWKQKNVINNTKFKKSKQEEKEIKSWIVRKLLQKRVRPPSPPFRNPFLQEHGLFYLVSTSLSKLLNAACFWRWIDHSLIKQEGVLFLSLFLLLNKSHTSVYLSNCTYFKKKKEGALYTTTWKLGINMCEKKCIRDHSYIT